MGVGWIWATILGVGIIFLPESPRHDFNHNNPARGRTTMSKFYGLPEDHVIINSECREIEQVMKLTAGDHPWYEAITGPRMLYRVALAMTLQMLQQLSGAVRFYFHHKVVF
jgi:MFS transporter, SP family, sugar:H+ symporter